MRRVAVIVGVVVVLAGAVACSPPSGLPGSRQVTVGNCQIEIRYGTDTGNSVWMAARKFGNGELFPADPRKNCAQAHMTIDVGAESWSCHGNFSDAGFGTGGAPDGQCRTYSAGVVGGVWIEARATGTLTSASLTIVDGYDATHTIDVFP